MAAIILRPAKRSPPFSLLSSLLSLRSSSPSTLAILRSSLSLLPTLSPPPHRRTLIALPSFAFIPDTLSSLRDLLPPWLLAVPKSKTSHSKKSMRHSNKGLKEQQGTLSFLSSHFFFQSSDSTGVRMTRYSCLSIVWDTQTVAPHLWRLLGNVQERV